MHRILLPTVYFSILILSWSKPTNAADLPSSVDLKAFPGTVMDEVIVPNPDELFHIMDKLGDPNWDKSVRKDFAIKKGNDRIDMALVFGALIADGFIAVQAEDAPQVKLLGQEILDLARALSLRDAVVGHCNAIIQHCDRGQWEQVRKELDQTHKTVREEMEKLRDDELAKCVSISGWIRGTEVLTKLIDDNYSAARAEILNQPDLAGHFIEQLEAMSPASSKKDSVKKILGGLKEVQKLMKTDAKEAIPHEKVAQINKICADIVESIIPPQKS